jgi:type I restriction enzyme S subunit
VTISWQARPLEECVEKVVYTAKIQRNAFLAEGSYPVISQEEGLINGYWNKVSDVFKVDRPLILFGDHTRSLKYVDFAFVLGADGVKVLEPKPFLDPRFFYYNLHTADLKSLGYARHYRLLKEHIVQFPPIAEQKRVVAILDQAFEAIGTAKTNAEKNVLHANDLFQSYVDRVFAPNQEGWRCSTVDAEFHFIDYRGKTPEKTKNGLRLITAKNVKMGYVQSEPEEFVAPSTYKTWMTRGIPQLGDILFTTEAPLGNVAQLDTDGKVVFAQRIIILQPQRLDRGFCKFLLMSPTVQRHIHEKGTGATVKGIKASLLKTVDVWFPDALSDQRDIVYHVKEVEEASQRLENINEAKVLALNHLRQSILSDAFSGKL